MVCLNTDILSASTSSSLQAYKAVWMGHQVVIAVDSQTNEIYTLIQQVATKKVTPPTPPPTPELSYTSKE